LTTCEYGTRTALRASLAVSAARAEPWGAKVFGLTEGEERRIMVIYATLAAAPAGSAARLKITLRPGIEWVMRSAAMPAATGMAPSAVWMRAISPSRSGAVIVCRATAAAPQRVLLMRLTAMLVSARALVGVMCLEVQAGRALAGAGREKREGGRRVRERGRGGTTERWASQMGLYIFVVDTNGEILTSLQFQS